MHMQASQPPLQFSGIPENSYWPAIHVSQTTLSELTTSHFNTLNMQIACPECAGKDPHCHAK